MIGRGIDYPGHRQRQNQPHFCCLLLLRLKGAALGIGIVLCLDAILLCGGQKPINLGGVKRRDVYIAGFFPYGRHVPESHIGRGVMPSVKLAVDHINDNPAVLRNYRLHMWWNDTEVRVIYHYFINSFFLPSLLCFGRKKILFPPLN